MEKRYSIADWFRTRPDPFCYFPRHVRLNSWMHQKLNITRAPPLCKSCLKSPPARHLDPPTHPRYTLPSTSMAFTLAEPAYNSLEAPVASRIFVVLFIIISVLVFMAVEAGNGYESIALSSTNYTQTSFLWYEHFPSWANIAPSWACQPSVIQRGQGLIPAIL